MKQITVRLEDGVHRAVKIRAAADGLAMEALARVWFETYANGGTISASTETTIRPRDGALTAGGETRGAEADPLRSIPEPPAVSALDGGLSRGDEVSTAGGGVTDTAPVRESPRAGSSETPAPPLKPHRADPKDKAAQEHGKKERAAAKGLCPHRVPIGSFCRRCEEEA